MLMVVTVFLEEALGEWLRLVLNVLLQLIWPLTQSGPIYIAGPTDTLLWLKVFMHQIGKEATPVELQLIRFELLWLIGLAISFCRADIPPFCTQAAIILLVLGKFHRHLTLLRVLQLLLLVAVLCFV